MKQALYTQTLGTGPELVLLHGWAMHSGIWEPLIPQLTQHFRVTLIDLPGFGRSAMLKQDYTLANIAEQILRAVPTPAIWLGWSLGGLITLDAAIQHPTAINKAIIVASNPRFMAEGDWPGLAFSTLQQFAQSLADDYQTTLNRFLALQLLNSQHTQELKAMLKAFFQRGIPSLSALHQGFKLISGTDLRTGLKNIRCPTQYIFGRSDALVPYSITDRLQQFHPNAEIQVIRHAGHAPFLSHPEEFLKNILKFCLNNAAISHE